MQARKVQFKLYVDNPFEIAVEPFVSVFHDWIRQKALGELLIDVTDYAHVHDGPSLLLVGHASDYCLDFAEGRAGLLYSRKRDAPADAHECVLDALRRGLVAAKKLEEEKSLGKPIRFRTDELLFRVNDRLLCPNTKEALASVEPVLTEVLSKAYAGAPLTLEQVGGPRELLTVRVRALGSAGTGVEALLKRVA